MTIRAGLACEASHAMLPGATVRAAGGRAVWRAVARVARVARVVALCGRDRDGGAPTPMPRSAWRKATRRLRETICLFCARIHCWHL